MSGRSHCWRLVYPQHVNYYVSSCAVSTWSLESAVNGFQITTLCGLRSDGEELSEQAWKIRSNKYLRVSFVNGSNLDLVQEGFCSLICLWKISPSMLAFLLNSTSGVLLSSLFWFWLHLGGFPSLSCQVGFWPWFLLRLFGPCLKLLQTKWGQNFHNLAPCSQLSAPLGRDTFTDPVFFSEKSRELSLVPIS